MFPKSKRKIPFFFSSSLVQMMQGSEYKVCPLNPSKDNTLETFWWVWITQTSILHSEIETGLICSRCYTAAGKLKPVVLFSMQPNSYCIWNFLTNELMLLVLRPARFSFFPVFPFTNNSVSRELHFRINESTSVLYQGNTSCLPLFPPFIYLNLFNFRRKISQRECLKEKKRRVELYGS